MAENPNEVTRFRTETSDQIRSRIEDTRAGMSDTIGEIRERLNPQRLMSDATQSLKAATVDRAKAHPVATAVGGAIALGVALRMMRRRRNDAWNDWYVERPAPRSMSRAIVRNGSKFLGLVAAAGSWYFRFKRLQARARSLRTVPTA